ncbi:hypothetical protein [Lacticaseibacillus sp. GG6-2]
MGETQKNIGIDPTTAVSFWRRNERTARFTALGIGVLIASGGAVEATSTINDGLAGGSFLLLVAIGVMLILTPRLGQHQQHKHRRVPIASDTRALAKQERLAYQRAHTIGLVFGIGMCIASPAAAAIANSDIGGALFMFGEAIGVFFIVYVNLVAAGYKRLTHDHAKLR